MHFDICNTVAGWQATSQIKLGRVGPPVGGSVHLWVRLGPPVDVQLVIAKARELTQKRYSVNLRPQGLSQLQKIKWAQRPFRV